MQQLKLLDNKEQPITIIPSVRELENTYRLAETIFDNLDDYAMHELTQGYGDDITNLMSMIVEETYNTIHAKKGPLQMGSFGYYEKLASNVEETLRKENLNYFITSVLPEFEMNWHHIEWGNMYQMHQKINIIAARGHGKTWDKFTKIIMYDGSRKNVQDIVVGDLVMGPDNKSRKVLNTHTVFDEGYEVQQAKGISYIVNQHHILHFKRYNCIKTEYGWKALKDRGSEKIVEMSAKDFYNKGDYWKSQSFGYRINGWDLPDQDLPIDPYIFGLWLGDGCSSGPVFWNIDKEIIDALQEYCNVNNFRFSTIGADRYRYGVIGKKNSPDSLRYKLRNLGVFHNKHIPEIYMKGSRKQRQELLAGIIDTDGYYSLHSNQFEVTLKAGSFTKQVQELAWSLGHRATLRKRTVKGFKREEVVIGIDVHTIPTRVERKQAQQRDRVQDGRNSSLKITKLPEKRQFWGFEVDGDHLHLIEDGTVVHNSYYFSLAVPIWRMYRYMKASIMHKTPPDYNLSKEGMLITSEIGLAQHLLNIIKDTVENNDILKPLLYPGTRDGWGGEEITCRNGAKLIAKSYGSKMRGYHPGYVVVDDFLTDQCLYSKSQRDKYTSIFHSVIMNMPPKNGSVAVVGTPFHQSDLYGDLKTKEGWVCAEYPGIFPDGTILWSWLFAFKDLMNKQKTQGSIIFAREILCRAVSNESSLFPYETINKAFEGMQHFTMINNNYGYSVKFVRIVCGWDIARSANVGADYSVWTTLGVDEKGHYWILNIRRERGKTFNEQINILKQLHANFNYDLIIIENNAMQQVFVDGALAENLPAEGHTTGVKKYSLEEGVPSLVVIFEQSRIHIPIGNKDSKNIADILAQELNSMAWTDDGLQGVGNHDDMVMSLMMAVIAARKGDNFRWSFL